MLLTRGKGTTRTRPTIDTMIGGAVLALALLGTPGAVAAQDAARTARVGTPVTGTLTAQDPKYGSRGAFHAYRFEAKAGTRYQVTMRGRDGLDAYVWVARMVGGLTEEIAADDDSGGETDALVRFRARETATHLLVAQSLEPAGTGAYELRVEELPPAPVATAVALPIGQAREGLLDDKSPILEDLPGEVRYALYRFTARGERVRVTVRSGAFDAMLRVTKVTADGEEEVGNDDDSGGGTDAQLVLTANGEYRIYARALETGKGGPFTVALSEVAVRPVTSRAITVGQAVDATLGSEDPELEDGRNFHQYAITGRPGERFVVTLRSREFDAFLSWGSLSGNVFETSSTDDDSGGDTDAKLEVVMPAEGTWVIRAHALERGQLGRYTILVERRTSK